MQSTWSFEAHTLGPGSSFDSETPFFSYPFMSGPSSLQSSTTTLHNHSQYHTPLEETLQREETRAEEYGGDDPEEPSPKRGDGLPPLKEVAPPDPHLVTWDGPNDPENPQNWSSRRKWAITILCVLLTINV